VVEDVEKGNSDVAIVDSGSRWVLGRPSVYVVLDIPHLSK
jgi:hypothetical protein